MIFVFVQFISLSQISLTFIDYNTVYYFEIVSEKFFFLANYYVLQNVKYIYRKAVTNFLPSIPIINFFGSSSNNNVTVAQS